MADQNQLEYLIPTGEHDVAIRDILIPILGDAVSCKVPGAECGQQTIHDAGTLVASVMQVFNSGTLIFLTILLLFISLFAFTRTAMEGVFMGRSWNSTYTALRLITGIAFLLPMPNHYSVIQNFVIYTGLWSAGLGNLASNAVSENYLARLQASMISREPNADSLTAEMQQILNMQLCVNYINLRYGGGAAGKNANLQLVKTDFTQFSFMPKSLVPSKIVYAYRETGNYFKRGDAPCGTFTVDDALHVSAQSVMEMGNAENQADGSWGSAFGGNPLTGDARMLMEEASVSYVKKLREKKTNLLIDAVQPSSMSYSIAHQATLLYLASLPQFAANGSVISSGTSNDEGTILTKEESETLIKDFAIYVAQLQESLTETVEDIKKEMKDASQDTAPGSFFALSREMLQSGGWMTLASTYRSMLDMVSIKFKPNDQPYSISSPSQSGLLEESEDGVNSAGAQVRYLIKLMQNTLNSHTAKAMIAGYAIAAGDESPVPKAPDEAALQTLITSVRSPNAAMNELYGSNWYDKFRVWIVKQAALSNEADPLFQIKNIGDMVTSTAEGLIVAEMTARISLSIADVTSTAATSNAIGQVLGLKGTSESVFRSLRYILESIFSTMSLLTMVLLALGYSFSTWLPALPFISFMMAQLGWIFGLILTLFTVNIWGVMHVTPARNDSFIGSEQQGYLLLVSLFFRPTISVCALALSYVMAPPIIKLVNTTLIPMMYVTSVSSNMLSILFGTAFFLILYFVVIKGVLVMIYSIPQSFPDEVMRIISAGIGDLGQANAVNTMGSGDNAARIVTQTGQNIQDSGAKRFQGKMNANQERRKKEAAQSEEKLNEATKSDDSQSKFGGAGGVIV